MCTTLMMIISMGNQKQHTHVYMPKSFCYPVDKSILSSMPGRLLSTGGHERTTATKSEPKRELDIKQKDNKK